MIENQLEDRDSELTNLRALLSATSEEAGCVVQRGFENAAQVRSLSLRADNAHAQVAKLEAQLAQAGLKEGDLRAELAASNDARRSSVARVAEMRSELKALEARSQGVASSARVLENQVLSLCLFALLYRA